MAVVIVVSNNFVMYKAKCCLYVNFLVFSTV